MIYALALIATALAMTSVAVYALVWYLRQSRNVREQAARASQSRAELTRCESVLVRIEREAKIRRIEPSEHEMYAQNIARRNELVGL